VFHSLVFNIVAWARRRRLLVVAIVLVTVAASAEGVRRLSFDPDVLSLLPRDGRVIPAFREYLARIGSLDQLYVVFTAPEGHSIGDYENDIDAWIEALRAAPEIARVDTGTADRTRDFEWLADRRLLLLDGPRLDQALARLQPEGIRHAVAESRTLLSVPSPAIADLVRYDPIGLLALVRDSLGGTQQGLNIGVTGGGYLSKDNRSRLIIARPKRPPFDAEFSRALDARLKAIDADLVAHRAQPPDEDEPHPAMSVEFAGGHRVAVETEAIVRHEAIMNTVGSLALILPLLFIVYRSFWLVLVGSLPSGLSLVVVLGALGLAGARLSAAATGASAMLFGLGVDGVVLIYVAYLLHLASDEPEDAASGLTGPSMSMLLGMWTTAATFYGLTFVDFPSLQQLGLLIGHSMMVCGLLTLIMVPALLPRKAPARKPRTLTMPRLAAWIGRHRAMVSVVAVLLTVVLGLLATKLTVNPTLDRLRSATGAAVLETKIASMFGLPSDVYVVLQEGQDLDPLLATNERMVARVTRELPQLALQAPTSLVPSTEAQAGRAARVRATGLTPGAVKASLAAAGDEEGFKAGSFAPFDDRLPFILDASQRLTYDGYVQHGLADLVNRFIVHDDGGWLLVTYAFPSSPEEAGTLQRIVNEVDPTQTLTGLALVNQELARRFMPQFMKGLAIGTAMVVVLVVLAFRNWRLSLFALLPTAVGLVWTAGILGLFGIELDLFAMFAVVTFLGIGVDYGIHLVHRFKEHGDAERATAELAPVIFVAGAITILGYGTLFNSSYPPLRSIGVVSGVSVIALAAASVMVLPALLQLGQRDR
jgi:predicted RND superfamily exporter protein